MARLDAALAAAKDAAESPKPYHQITLRVPLPLYDALRELAEATRQRYQAPDISRTVLLLVDEGLRRHHGASVPPEPPVKASRRQARRQALEASAD